MRTHREKIERIATCWPFILLICQLRASIVDGRLRYSKSSCQSVRCARLSFESHIFLHAYVDWHLSSSALGAKIRGRGQIIKMTPPPLVILYLCLQIRPITNITWWQFLPTAEAHFALYIYQHDSWISKLSVKAVIHTCIRTYAELFDFENSTAFIWAHIQRELTNTTTRKLFSSNVGEWAVRKRKNVKKFPKFTSQRFLDCRGVHSLLFLKAKQSRKWMHLLWNLKDFQLNHSLGLMHTYIHTYRCVHILLFSITMHSHASFFCVFNFV